MFNSNCVQVFMKHFVLYNLECPLTEERKRKGVACLHSEVIFIHEKDAICHL